MIAPADKWNLQIDVTNACHRACSNCTRFTGHIPTYFMSVEQFEQAVNAVKDFGDGPIPVHALTRAVGVIGGEPTLHSEFGKLCEIMHRLIPNKKNCSLSPGIDWEKSPYADVIRETFWYVNPNTHTTPIYHTPVLVAIKDVIRDSSKMWEAIDECWLSKLWSSGITVKGYFHCEMAGAFDLLYDGPGGLPVEPGCWRRPLSDFQEQIERWCPLCGIPLNLKGRRDNEQIDDIGASHLKSLKDSPRIKAGKYRLFDPASHKTVKTPWEYGDLGWNPPREQL